MAEYTTALAEAIGTDRAIREQLKNVMLPRNISDMVDDVIHRGKASAIVLPSSNKVVATFITEDGLSVGHGEAYINKDEDGGCADAISNLHLGLRDEVSKLVRFTQGKRFEWHVANVKRAATASTEALIAVFGSDIRPKSQVVNNVLFYFRNPAASEKALHEVMCATRSAKDVPFEELSHEEQKRLSLERAVVKGFIPNNNEY